MFSPVLISPRYHCIDSNEFKISETKFRAVLLFMAYSFVPFGSHIGISPLCFAKKEKLEKQNWNTNSVVTAFDQIIVMDLLMDLC